MIDYTLHTPYRQSEFNLAAYLSALRGDCVDLPLVDALAEWPVDVRTRRNKVL